MISTRFIDYIILNSKMQLEVTEGQKVASNSKNKIKIRKCTYICHFLWRSNFKFRKCTISYDSQKYYQTKLWIKFFLILFCSSGNEDLPFLRTIWEYSEILMGSWQMAWGQVLAFYHITHWLNVWERHQIYFAHETQRFCGVCNTFYFIFFFALA